MNENSKIQLKNTVSKSCIDFAMNEELWYRGEKMTKELIERINFLSRKSRSEGLSETEKEEQARLRQQYIAEFRQGMENTMNNVYIMDKDGNKTKVQKKK